MAGTIPSSGAPVERYGTREGAAAYRAKHEESLLRRVASWRERALLRRMLDRLGPLESVLDCPCGAGRFLPLLATHAERVWAVDRSPEMVRVARGAAAFGRFSVGDAVGIPLPDRAVDAVVCMRLLHHIQGSEDRTRVLAEAGRVARKAVIVSFADAETWKGRRTRSRRRPISRAQLSGEAQAAGLVLESPTHSVAGLFSAFSFAFFRVRAADSGDRKNFSRGSGT